MQNPWLRNGFTVLLCLVYGCRSISDYTASEMVMSELARVWETLQIRSQTSGGAEKKRETPCPVSDSRFVTQISQTRSRSTTQRSETFGFVNIGQPT